MMNENEKELFQERVAIMVFDGGVEESKAKDKTKLYIIKLRNYEDKKRKWLAENPQATSQEYEKFIKELADILKI